MSGLIHIIFIIVVLVIVFVANRRASQALEKALQEYRGKLRDPDPKIRRQVVLDVTRLLQKAPRMEGIVQLWLHAAQDADETVQCAAIDVLSQQFHAQLSRGKTSIPVIGEHLKPSVRNIFKQAIVHPQPSVRKAGIVALGRIHKTSFWKADVLAPLKRMLASAPAPFPDDDFVPLLAQALQDPESSSVRLSAVEVARKFRDIRLIPPLFGILADQSSQMPVNIHRTIGEIGGVVQTVIFGKIGGWAGETIDRWHTLVNPNVAGLTAVLPELQHVLINALTCDQQLVETFGRYLKTANTRQPDYLKKSIQITLYGDPTRFSPDVQHVWRACKSVESTLDTVVFGPAPSEQAASPRIAYNLDAARLMIPLNRLTRIVINAGHYDFHRVERFLTYALEYLGQTYLHAHVTIEIQGDPAQLHPNLYNNFKNICALEAPGT